MILINGFQVTVNAEVGLEPGEMSATEFKLRRIFLVGCKRIVHQDHKHPDLFSFGQL
jgi:hypothetical protein